MRPTSSAQQRPVSRRKRLDDLKASKEPSTEQGAIEELNIRVANRTTSNAPKGIFDTLRESVVSRGPDQKIDIKDTLKRPLTGLFRRTKQSQNQLQQQSQQNQQNNEREPDNEDHEVHQTNLAFDDNMSVLNLNPNSETMGMESVDFSTVDFGKFEDIDISCLARLICVQSEITDEEEPWSWETLFANVTTEMREEWQHYEEDEEGGQAITALNSI